MNVVPTVLLILDGYGLAPESTGNAAKLASTPTLDRILAMPGATQINASGRAVGLPNGYMGNSEVGHLNIGAGRVVYQQLTRIDVAIENKELDDNPILLNLFTKVKASNGRLHLLGLLSNGGVHSHIRHLEVLLNIAKKHTIQVILHLFMDGRDTGPKDGLNFMKQIVTFLTATSSGTIGSFCGRFYAMDRDKRWERIKLAWDAIVHGIGLHVENPVVALEQAYESGETDEFIKPRIIGDAYINCVQDNDALLFFNFRADRARELVSAFALPDFNAFDRGRVPHLAGIATMTMYDQQLNVPVLFNQENITKTLGEIVSELDLLQLRIAETEKYAHVTYFFSGGREEIFPGEERILVQSPKDVATYDLKPEMSVFEVTNQLLDVWNSKNFSLIVCNLANPDMVGHTGSIKASIAALEAVDKCVGRIEEAVAKQHGCFILTADHGNVEEMLDKSGQLQTAHSCNPVPLVAIYDGKPLNLQHGGKLGDIAPTILSIWDAPIPHEMTGNNLFFQGDIL